MAKDRNIKTIQLYGGRLCLDFINTVHSRTEQEVFDYLKDYRDVISWGALVGVLSGKQLKELIIYSQMHRIKAEEAFKKIKTAREELHELFLPLASGGKPGKKTMHRFNSYLSETLARLRLEHRSEGMRQIWDETSDPLMLPLWMVIRSAYEVLLNDPVERIKACPACGWLFLDTTKNNGRRWCSSQGCGSIDKATRYYYRKKQQASETVE